MAEGSKGPGGCCICITIVVFFILAFVALLIFASGQGSNCSEDFYASWTGEFENMVTSASYTN